MLLKCREDFYSSVQQALSGSSDRIPEAGHEVQRLRCEMSDCVELESFTLRKQIIWLQAARQMEGAA